MRLHRLALAAFGPFAAAQEIDFDALSDAGLFLIDGPTGAGKTSVLDAVCFALYGRVPGQRNQAKTLHSDHAPRDRAPHVELEFTIRGRRLRVRRSPEWSRPKKRGDGETREHASVTVEEHRDGDWSPLTNRLDEAGQFLVRLIGMSAEQFCQVALLPQGEFARFLRAGADERRTVLERLFATEVYAEVERWLAERRRATGQEAETAHTAVVRVADRIEEVAGDLKIAPSEAEPEQLVIGEPERGRADVRPDDPRLLPDWAALLGAAARDASERAETALASATTAEEAARAAAETARDLAERRRRYAEATSRSAALAERADERTALAATIDRAQRAARVIPLLTAADRRARASSAATKTAAETLGRVAAFLDLPAHLLAAATDGAPGESGEPRLAPLLDALADAERARRDDAVRLDGLRAEASRLREMRAEKRDGAARLESLLAEERRTAAAVDELPDRCAELETGRDAARERAAAAAGIAAAVETAEARLAAAVRRDDLNGRLAQARAEASAATDTAQHARDELQRVRAARIAGMAAELAGRLSGGDPCPVCGSAEHPDPARPAEDAPTPDAEHAAEERYEAARRAREAAEKQVTEVSGALETATEAASGRSEADARAELEARRGELAGAEAARAEAGRLDERYRAAAAELEDARKRATAIAREVAELRTREEARDAEIERVAAVLDDARGADSTIEARADRVTSEAEMLRAAADAIGRAETARAELADARRAAEEAAATGGFADTGDARAAALDDAALAEAAERRRGLDAEEATVAELLADPELAAAAAAPAPDLAGVEAALAAATDARMSAASARDHARTRHTRLTELGADLDRAVATWRPAAHLHDVAARMAALTAGTAADNRDHMKLSAYVLAARLEQVVAAANDRLERMSAGRYLLEHTTDRARGDRRVGSGGLGLRVVDTWTMRPREPATLSGGETFISSLALALGLADVVTAEAGGAEIATLFVDEGFGSLDADTLDEVMDVLDDLREGGRAVGIVSHVAELRARVAARLTVSKTRSGSALTAVA